MDNKDSFLLNRTLLDRAVVSVHVHECILKNPGSTHFSFFFAHSYLKWKPFLQTLCISQIEKKNRWIGQNHKL